MQQMANPESSRYSGHPKIEAIGPRIQSVTVQHGHMTTFNQSQLGLSGTSITHSLPSPPGSKSATPSPSSSVHEDEPEDSTKVQADELIYSFCRYRLMNQGKLVNYFHRPVLEKNQARFFKLCRVVTVYAEVIFESLL